MNELSHGFLARTISWEDHKHNYRDHDLEEGMYGSNEYQTFEKDNGGYEYGLEQFYYNKVTKQEADKKGIICEASDFVPFNTSWYSSEVGRLEAIIKASLNHKLVDIGQYDNPIYYFEYEIYDIHNIN